jgi:catechol 2,3-dioxygenase-like lactoylglutathione lyase family enzyme
MPVLLALHPVLMSRDVDESIQFFGRLGFALSFKDDPSAPSYAVLTRDRVQLHVQRHGDVNAFPQQDRPVYRLLVDDVVGLHHELTVAANDLLASPAETPWFQPAITPWGTREFHLRDPSRNSLQFYQPL